jgi:hypothetical protein
VPQLAQSRAGDTLGDGVDHTSSSLAVHSTWVRFSVRTTSRFDPKKNQTTKVKVSMPRIVFPDQGRPEAYLSAIFFRDNCSRLSGGTLPRPPQC